MIRKWLVKLAYRILDYYKAWPSPKIKVVVQKVYVPVETPSQGPELGINQRFAYDKPETAPVRNSVSSSLNACNKL